MRNSHVDSTVSPPNGTAAIYRLENVSRRYGERVVLNLASLEIRAGEILGILGHNGSGKSTLLRILALLEAPDDGRLWLDGEPVSFSSLSQRRQVTLLLQTPYLLSRSVEANIAYGLGARGLHGPAARQRVEEAMRQVGLEPALFLKRRRHELSGGEAQRVALAARLALRPRILLMDEPTASVDEESAGRIATAARRTADQGSAVVIVSHDYDWIAPLADRLIRLKGGRQVDL